MLCEMEPVIEDEILQRRWFIKEHMGGWVFGDGGKMENF